MVFLVSFYKNGSLLNSKYLKAPGTVEVSADIYHTITSGAKVTINKGEEENAYANIEFFEGKIKNSVALYLKDGSGACFWDGDFKRNVILVIQKFPIIAKAPAIAGAHSA